MLSNKNVANEICQLSLSDEKKSPTTIRWPKSMNSPLLWNVKNSKINLMTKLEEPLLKICDQNQLILLNQIQLSIVNFFVKPPEGAEHSLKCIKSKSQQHFYLRNFSRPSTLLLCEKSYLLVKKHRKVNLVIFHSRFKSSNSFLFELEPLHQG